MPESFLKLLNRLCKEIQGYEYLMVGRVRRVRRGMARRASYDISKPMMLEYMLSLRGVSKYLRLEAFL